ncbi:MAG: hypothetical protein QGD94_10240, partial [Planctomycetia bacterium]|nr:hypothetical protein [Planctomycetia bacterium]
SDGKPLPFAGKAPYLKDNVLGGGKPPAGNIAGNLIAVGGDGYIYAAGRSGRVVRKYGPDGVYMSWPYYITDVKFERSYFAFTRGEKITAKVFFRQESGVGEGVTLSYFTEDYFGKRGKRGKIEAFVAALGMPVELSVPLDLKENGFYTVTFSIKGPAGGSNKYRVDLSVVSPRDTKIRPDSSFGCHRWSATNLERVHILGIRWTRGDGYCSWNNIEPKKGVFEYETTEVVWEKKSKLGFIPMPILDYMANWDVPAEELKKQRWNGEKGHGQGGYLYGWSHVPSNFNEYGNYAAKMARHFKGRIFAWNIWNEPDCFWGGTKQQYVDLVQEAYQEIKKIQPDALIVAGDALNMGSFEQMYKLGIGKYTDVIGVHYIMGSQVVTRMTGKGIYDKIMAMRKIMAKYGDEDKPLWDTEENVNNQPTPEDRANAYVYFHVVGLAYNMPKIFWFPKPIGYYHDSGMTTRLAVAQSTLADYMEGVKFEKRLDLGSEDAFALRFRREKDRVTVLWDDAKERKVTIPVESREVYLIDIQGKRRKLWARGSIFRAGRRVKITITRSPVFVQEMLK